jgi:hypothetical protein
MTTTKKSNPCLRAARNFGGPSYHLNAVFMINGLEEKIRGTCLWSYIEPASRIVPLIQLLFGELLTVPDLVRRLQTVS